MLHAAQLGHFPSVLASIWGLLKGIRTYITRYSRHRCVGVQFTAEFSQARDVLAWEDVESRIGQEVFLWQREPLFHGIVRGIAQRRVGLPLGVRPRNRLSIAGGFYDRRKAGAEPSCEIQVTVFLPHFQFEIAEETLC